MGKGAEDSVILELGEVLLWDGGAGDVVTIEYEKDGRQNETLWHTDPGDKRAGIFSYSMLAIWEETVNNSDEFKSFERLGAFEKGPRARQCEQHLDVEKNTSDALFGVESINGVFSAQVI